MTGRHDVHYVRSVVRMGDSRHVFTNQAIFTTNRIKLVEKGVRVDSELFERLVSHKLIPKLDECLSVDHEITQRDLLDHACQLLENDPCMSVINREKRTRAKILQAIEAMTLVPPLAFKLTVASEQRPEVYDHSIRIALIAIFLAIKSFFFSQKELTTLATAAIFHDLGILHIPPNLLDAGRKLQKSERHYLYSHPITAFLLLRKFPEYHPDVSRTVFEHHERLDGSGYPRGLKAEEICLAAQILMLAEVANTVFKRSASSKAITRLSILLRINHLKFNNEVANRLLSTLQRMMPEDESQEDPVKSSAEFSSFERHLTEVAQIFQLWHETTSLVQPGDDPDSWSALFCLISERIQELEHSLNYAGFDLQDTKTLAELGKEDDETLQELAILAGETRWQLSEIIHEAHRRLNDADMPGSIEATPLIHWMERSESILKIH